MRSWSYVLQEIRKEYTCDNVGNFLEFVVRSDSKLSWLSKTRGRRIRVTIPKRRQQHWSVRTPKCYFCYYSGFDDGDLCLILEVFSWFVNAFLLRTSKPCLDFSIAQSSSFPSLLRGKGNPQTPLEMGWRLRLLNNPRLRIYWPPTLARRMLVRARRWQIDRNVHKSFDDRSSGYFC